MEVINAAAVVLCIGIRESTQQLKTAGNLLGTREKDKQLKPQISQRGKPHLPRSWKYLNIREEDALLGRGRGGREALASDEAMRDAAARRADDRRSVLVAVAAMLTRVVRREEGEESTQVPGCAAL
ncbi:hypothetical protein AXF42_Ash020741 [Apostasia shenzhenica]|uniref:Uncharacterized protein n=1 Tax=Apostasia shenzhenica TaxID=1088818 RepID=A0A2I0APL5_9ASPA|nr:hypothetical protein AXF42_Ash020741 [Apostasia shenzhenica]